MSRGPGRWQRAILEALQTQSSVFALDLFPHHCGRRQHFVFRRAAERLAERGLVTLQEVSNEYCVRRREVSHLDEVIVTVHSPYLRLIESYAEAEGVELEAVVNLAFQEFLERRQDRPGTEAP